MRVAAGALKAWKNSLQLLGGPTGKWIMASLCLAWSAGCSGGRKRVRRNSLPKQQAWRLSESVEVAEKAVVAVVAALAAAVDSLGTRGPFEGRQEVPGRLTSCLSSLSQARVRGREGGRGGKGGLVQPN